MSMARLGLVTRMPHCYCADRIYCSSPEGAGPKAITGGKTYAVDASVLRGCGFCGRPLDFQAWASTSGWSGEPFPIFWPSV